MDTTSDGAVVVLGGRLDARHAAQARDALHGALAAGTGDLVVDLSAVELIDATGLGVLVGAHRRARLEGRDLVLRGIPPRVGRLLARTRLGRVLTVEDRQSLSA
jgi:anti-sigma B factor antagonist